MPVLMLPLPQNNMLQAADSYLLKHSVVPLIDTVPAGELGFVVCIPAYKEPDPLLPIISLYNADAPQCAVEVLILFNYPENSSSAGIELTTQGYDMVKKWAAENNTEKFRVYPILAGGIPLKHAGAGMARKLVMDQAVTRLRAAENPAGIITGFDADSLCDKNYFTAITEQFTVNPETTGASIHFEHPISGNEYPEQAYKGITLYETHLRYISQAMRYSGFPYFFHTVGSSFAVRADIYVAQGGMNRRKAGEDFYFLHKIMPLGEYVNISGTTIIPSPRTSDRVPFGTGVSIAKWINDNDTVFYTYPFAVFESVKPLFNSIEGLYRQSLKNAEKLITDNTLVSFLEKEGWEKKWDEIQSNCSSIVNFKKRFFRWFDGFLFVKYLNYYIREEMPKSPLQKECTELAKCYGWKDFPDSFPEILEWLREEDKKISLL